MEFEMAIESVSEGVACARGEQSFMKGKALAAAMAMAVSTGGNVRRELVAEYRGDDTVEQDNFVRKYLVVLLESPDLLGGFSAGLTQLLEEGFDHRSGIAQSVAAVSYEACHSLPGEDGNRCTAPPLNVQLLQFGLANLAEEMTTAEMKEVAHG
jgi:hypothetical protein